MNEMNSIVERIKNGDMNGWSYVYQSYYDKLYRHALALTNGNTSNAQDAVQSAFTRAMSDNRIQTLRNNDKLFEWLSSFVLNEVRPMWRVQRRYMTFSTDEEYANTFDSFADDELCIPEEYAMDEAFKRRMKKAIESLTEKQRIVVQMYYYENKNIPQIAAYMQLSQSAVKTHLVAARKKLKKYIENYEKNGSKFRIIVPIPFLFQNEMPKGIYTAGIKTAGTVIATKALSAVLAGLVAVNMAAAGVIAINNNSNAIDTSETVEDSNLSTIDNNTFISDMSEENTNDDRNFDSETSTDDGFEPTAIKEFSNGFYEIRFPEYMKITYDSLDEMEIVLNREFRVTLAGDKTYSLKIQRTNGFSDNNDLNIIKNEMSEKYSKENNSSKLYDVDYENQNVLIYKSYRNSDTISNDGVSIKRKTDSPKYSYYNGTVFTASGFYIVLSISSENEEDLLDDEILYVLENLKLNSEDLNKLNENLTAKLIELATADAGVIYPSRISTSGEELINKYYDGEITFYTGTDTQNPTGEIKDLKACGMHDGVETEISWSIYYHKEVNLNTDSDKSPETDKSEGNIIMDIPAQSTYDNLIVHNPFDNIDNDVIFWYLDRDYQLNIDTSPNSTKFDSTDIADYDITNDEDCRDAWNRNFEYKTEVIAVNGDEISFRSPYYGYNITTNYNKIIQNHNHYKGLEQFKKCSSMTDDDYRNLKVGDKVTVYVRFFWYESGVLAYPYDLYIENGSADN